MSVLLLILVFTSFKFETKMVEIWNTFWVNEAFLLYICECNQEELFCSTATANVAVFPLNIHYVLYNYSYITKY